MKTINISQFKAKCIAILKAVARNSEPVIVTHRGKPLARVEPVEQEKRGRTLGGLQGAMQIRADIVVSDFAEDWDTSEQGPRPR